MSAGQNPEAAANIVLENDATGAQTEAHQVRMTFSHDFGTGEDDECQCTEDTMSILIRAAELRATKIWQA